MKKNILYLFLLLTSIFFAGCSANAIKISDLTVEDVANPLGIEAQHPRFSWKLSSNERSLYQEAYQILVSSSADNLAKGIGDVWDSGKTESSETLFIPYAGKALESNQTYYWAVKIWTNQGEAQSTANQKWSMGLLSSNDWKGKWIGLESITMEGEVRDTQDPKWKGEEKSPQLNARYLRKEIEINKKVKCAYWHISGLGLNYSYINGKITGDYVLAPTPSNYLKTVYYNTFDVTNLLTSGKNTLGVILGNGRYFTMRNPGMRHFGLPKLLSQLEVTYTDGTKESFVSDETWKVTANGPIGVNNEFDGEHYDARKEMPNWNKNDYKDNDWHQAELVSAPQGKLKAQENPNIKIMDTVEPISIKKIDDIYVLDMGQNMVGWVQMKVKGEAGNQVKLRYAEGIYDDGKPDYENLRSAKVTDLYTLKGGVEEVWQPSFVYYGFRYVEITGYPGEPTLKDFEGKVIYDEMKTTGRFETSNATINQIHKNAFWGIRGNYRGMPTDCPQRDERLGWLGDRTTGAYGESFIFGNNSLYEKWLQDIHDCQREDGAISDVSPHYWTIYSNNMTWPAAYPFVSEMLYNQYGNKQPIIEHYDSFKLWLEMMKNEYMQDYIVTKDTHGDWCMPPEDINRIHASDPNRKTDGAVLSTTYYYYLTGMMQKFAKMTNNEKDIPYYKDLGEKIRVAFNEKYYNEAEKTYSNNTITANLLAVMCGLVDDANKEAVMANIVNKTKNELNNHIGSGVVGIQWLMRGLTDNNYADLAYIIATNTDYPSWGYMAENGATTIWELWNGNTADRAMNSQNHVMLLGDLVIWYYEYLAGIKSDNTSTTGFKNITMKPLVVGDLKYVDASYNSPRGEIKSHWTREDKKFTWNITVPGNTTAKVYLPNSFGDNITESGKILEQVKGIKKVSPEDQYTVVEIGSGDYSFEVK